jgi:hypothetical protein
VAAAETSVGAVEETVEVEVEEDIKVATVGAEVEEDTKAATAEAEVVEDIKAVIVEEEAVASGAVVADLNL